MSGIRIVVDDAEVRQILGAMTGHLADMGVVMRAISRRMLARTNLRFRRQVDPDGRPWPPSKRAKRTGGKTLVDTGRLLRSINASSDQNTATVGTNVAYAAAMHFGARMGEFGEFVHVFVKPHTRRVRGREVQVSEHLRTIPAIPWGDIPPRPFLGISAEDKGDIRDIVLKHLGRGR